MEDTTIIWFTVREVATRWRCSNDSILRMIHVKAIDAMKLGGAWRIHRDAIQKRERAGRPEPVQARRPRVSSSLYARARDHVGDLSSDEFIGPLTRRRQAQVNNLRGGNR